MSGGSVHCQGNVCVLIGSAVQPFQVLQPLLFLAEVNLKSIKVCVALKSIVRCSKCTECRMPKSWLYLENERLEIVEMWVHCCCVVFCVKVVQSNVFSLAPEPPGKSASHDNVLFFSRAFSLAHSLECRAADYVLVTSKRYWLGLQCLDDILNSFHEASGTLAQVTKIQIHAPLLNVCVFKEGTGHLC